MNKFLSMLGLCRKAGALIIGTPMVTEALPKGKVKIVFYANDASGNTEKKITDKCKFYNVECIKVGFSSSELSSAIGKSGALCALGIVDKNFAGELLRLHRTTNEETR
ncbi:MAG: ribosomal L7Ae/L30e/S12e/Gadd45 family protein [Clostridia bacterium]|nr:ribosomal L7Ae/L30e/S12e/Gadd45 family protein [Clostridia bacterium]MBR2296674.1 ribosomal L7Ae/L30e/S12e/Gadd45 family protein [Clostridia bacterium]